MTESILALEPKRLWHYFYQICQYPHGSGNEKPLRNYLLQLAQELSIECEVDDVGNILMRKPASSGLEFAKPVVLQGHLDMICEKNPGTAHDFSKDPINATINGEWVAAKNTTLGADGGIGLAAALAVMEDKGSIGHGPLECVFTSFEESTLDGAFGLRKDALKGKFFLNLDSENEGILFVGCAGGWDTFVNFPVSISQIGPDYAGLSISISGLKGGHSGLVIHKQGGNAIKLLARILYYVHRRYNIVLSEINGGIKRNIVPTNAEAVIAIKRHERGRIIELIEEIQDEIGHELKIVDPEFKVTLKETSISHHYDPRTSNKIISFLYTVPHGVITMSYEFPGIVQTSTNLAIAKSDKDKVFFQFLSRSSSEADLNELRNKLAAHAELLGVDVEEADQYPCWHQNPKSVVLQIAKNTYQELFEKWPGVAAIHAGLACCIIGKKYPDMDMISFGPDIRDVHTTNERVNIKSVEKFWRFLTRLLHNLTRE